MQATQNARLYPLQGRDLLDKVEYAIDRYACYPLSPVVVGEGER